MNTKRLHLLIVEDEEAHVEAIRRAFDPAGADADIHAVSTLREYREYITVHPPDLALLDLNLPDGRAVEELTHPPEKAPFPILVMTAFGNQHIVVEVMKAGALDYVVKSPESFAMLPRTVESALREWKLLRGQKQAEESLRVSEGRYRNLFESSSDAILTLEPPSWKFATGNPAAVKMFKAKNEEDLVSHAPSELSPERQPDGRPSAEKAREITEMALSEGSHFFEWTHRRVGGEEFPASVLLTRMEQGNNVSLQATVRDITQRKQAEARQQLALETLRVLNRPNDLPVLVRDLIALMKSTTGFDAVGLRIRLGDNFPYYAQNGFSNDFVKEENFLCAKGKDAAILRAADGKLVLECTCGLVLSGGADPSLPCFTKGGSFWTNVSSELLALAPEADPRKQPPQTTPATAASMTATSRLPSFRCDRTTKSSVCCSSTTAGVDGSTRSWSFSSKAWPPALASPCSAN